MFQPLLVFEGFRALGALKQNIYYQMVGQTNVISNDATQNYPFFILQLVVNLN